MLFRFFAGEPSCFDRNKFCAGECTEFLTFTAEHIFATEVGLIFMISLLFNLKSEYLFRPLSPPGNDCWTGFQIVPYTVNG